MSILRTSLVTATLALPFLSGCNIPRDPVIDKIRGNEQKAINNARDKERCIIEMARWLEPILGTHEVQRIEAEATHEAQVKEAEITREAILKEHEYRNRR